MNQETQREIQKIERLSFLGAYLRREEPRPVLPEKIDTSDVIYFLELCETKEAK